MAKRMVLMLLAVLVVIAGLGFVKYRQIETAMKAFASFQPAAGCGHDDSAKQEQLARHAECYRHGGGGTGRDGERRSARDCRRITFDRASAGQAGDVLVELDTRQEQAQLAAAEAQRDLAQVNFKRLDGLVKEGVIAQADFDKAQAEQKRDGSAGRKRSAPPLSARRSARLSPAGWAFARSISGSIWLRAIRSLRCNRWIRST